MKKELKLSDIRKKLDFNLHKGLSLELRFMNKNKFDFDVYLKSIDKNLQRDFVWSLEQKKELILSIIKEIDIRKFSFVINHDTKIIEVIDGKQRLSTIFAFINNEFTIIVNNEEYLFNELNEIIQRSILSYNYQYDCVYTDSYRTITDIEKIDWFEKLNFVGTPQDKEHLINLKK